MWLKVVLSIVLLVSGAAITGCAAPIVVLDPVSGDISGAPGQVVGWGFTITNPDPFYIEFNSAQFCVDPVILPSCTDPLTGTFNDFISAVNDVIIGPPGGTLDSTVTQGFDAMAQTGIGSFMIDLAGMPGDTDIGQLVLTYTATDLDPRDPHAKFLFTDQLLVHASVTVVAAPEPATWLLLAITGPVWLGRRLKPTR